GQEDRPGAGRVAELARHQLLGLDASRVAEAKRRVEHRRISDGAPDVHDGEAPRGLPSSEHHPGMVLGGRKPSGRFAIVNVWRSIGNAPVLDTPLGLCDARSVQPEELVTSELRYPARTGAIFLA